MPNWGELVNEINHEIAVNKDINPFDTVRKRYIQTVSDLTGRNVIAYYSSFLTKEGASDLSINDRDKSGFMLTVHGLDKTKGLDLILHTPGGDVAATESIVDYLYSIFGKDIRVIVPQIAMSAGTMIALASKEIVMGKHSNLGPIDPQMGGLPCQAVVDEFEVAIKEVTENPNSSLVWQHIISKYHPTFLGSCKNAIIWSKEMVSKWLKENMCAENVEQGDDILEVFSNHNHQKTHNRHISKSECEKVGLNITSLEQDQAFQDAILSAHHMFMHTFDNTSAIKIIENNLGIAFINQHKQQ